MSTKYVGYLRVSTQRQHASGLGISAQRHAVKQFLNGRTLIAEFQETESGKHADRPQLNAAIALCRKHKATLVISSISRLARNAAFVLSLRDSGVDFVACDLPEASRLTVGIMALMAEQERDWVSERTKAALQAAKKRGTKLGNPRLAQARRNAIKRTRAKAVEFAASLSPIIAEIRAAGVHTLKGIAQCLNARGCKAARGGQFTQQIVSRILHRLKQ